MPKDRPAPTKKQILKTHAKKYGFAGEAKRGSKPGTARAKPSEGPWAQAKHRAHNYLNTTKSIIKHDAAKYRKSGRGR